MKILLACDRSRGHLYPALILAEYIRERKKAKVFFSGLSKKDREYVQSLGFVCSGIDLGFRNIFLESILRAGEAIFILLYLRPQRIVGFGGRNSFFLIAMGSFFIPVYIYEPNFFLGKANKILSFFARKVFVAKKRREKQIEVGIPLRRELVRKLNKKEAQELIGLDKNKFTLLAFGGSQGSSFLNHLVFDVTRKLSPHQFQLIHITGSREFEYFLKKYKNLKLKVKVFDYYEDMGVLYSSADLVLSRAGASTLAEINYFGVLSVLFPYPHAYAHQKINAQYFKDRDAAILLCQEGCETEKVSSLIENLAKNREKSDYLRYNIKKIKLWENPDIFAQKLFSYIY